MSGIVGQVVDRLRAAGVNLAPGLSEQELTRIEERFGFTFGPEHRELLATVVPDGESWVDWRHGSSGSLNGRLSWPIEGVIFDVQNNGFWPTSWGERPSDSGPIERQARDYLARVPQLVPLFSHRYLAAGAAYAPSPVFSVYQTDVIYYGDNLLDYIAHEFNVPPLCPSRKRPHVPFWSDLADGLDAADL